MMRTILFALLLAACGGGSKTAAPANDTQPAAGHETPPPEAATDGDTPTSCDDACTLYAVCHEEVYGGDFKYGGECVSNCEEKTPDEQKTYFESIGESQGDCKKMMGDDGGEEGE